MNIERYTYIRKELIRLYKLFSERTFLVFIPPSSFLTLEQLDRAKERPPLTGFETLEQPVERPYTIQYLLRAVDIMGDDIHLGFRYPRQDIPVIYESIQTWIKYWIEIKVNLSYMRTPDISELELIERLARFVFTPYSHYYHERINKDMRLNPGEEITLVTLLRGTMMHGKDFGEPISYISHLDQYKSTIGYSSSYGSHSGGTLDFLRGFGGGM